MFNFPYLFVFHFFICALFCLLYFLLHIELSGCISNILYIILKESDNISTDSNRTVFFFQQLWTMEKFQTLGTSSCGAVELAVFKTFFLRYKVEISWDYYICYIFD